jgi:hypothetical protein
MSDFEFQTNSQGQSLPSRAPLPLAIKPRLNGFRKNTHHTVVPLFDRSVSDKQVGRSGEPSFGIRPTEGERMNPAEPAELVDPFDEPLE